MSSSESTATLLKACGVRGALELEIVGEQGQTRRQAFRQPFLVLGQNRRTDLPLEHPDVSQRHAYLQVLAGRVFCCDLLSRTGLRWEQAAAPAGWLDRGQSLRIGPFQIRVVGGVPEAPPNPADWNPLAACTPGEDDLPPVTLESQNRARESEPWPVNRVLTLVGSSSQCKVRIHATGVSRFSCSLLRTPEGLWVIDLLGLVETRVNDAPVRCALLHDGDYLRVGPLTLRVKYQAVHESRIEDEGWGIEPQPHPVLDPRSSILDPRSGPAPAGLPAEIGQAELAGFLTRQFAQMQQQMFEQFSQTLMMMGQMFNNLHRDQLALIRDELTRLQEVSQDLRTLQAELAQRQNGVLAGPTVPAGGAAASVSAIPPPEPAAPPPAAGGTAPPLRLSGPAAKPLPPISPAKKGAATDKSAPDIHAQLFERIQQLQQERESHWQKLLNYLTGKRPDETPH
jgi:hypothetical protein